MSAVSDRCRYLGYRYGTYVAVAVSVVLLFLIISFFVLPLFYAFFPLFMADVGEETSPWNILFSSKVLKVALYTLKQGLLSMVVALLIGIPAGFFTATRQFPGKKFILSLSAIPLCVPPLLVALGYVMFFGMQGVLNRWCMALWNLEEPPIEFLYSLWGIVLAQGFYNFPLVMKTCHDAWRQVSVREYNAACLLGASPFRIFRTITVVQLLPAIASSGMVVFLYSFFSFVIVLLFGGVGTTVLEVEIYQAARSSLNFPLAAALALTETLIAFGVLLLYGLLERKSRESRGLAWDAETFYPKKIQGFTEKLGALILAFLVILFFLMPFVQILFSALSQKVPGFSGGTTGKISLGNFIALFSRESFYVSFLNTLKVGIASGVLAVCVALTFACLVKILDPEKKSMTSRIIPLLPMAVSSVVLAFGITQVVSGGTVSVLILLQASLYWPFAFRQISGTMDRIPLDVLNGATLLSPFSLDGVFKIYIPLCRRNILSALGFCFALSCGDTTLPLVLGIPRFETLALYTYNLAGSYRFQEACACGVILALLTVPVFLISNREHTGT
ncbi:MAG: iron ABC transporter permease [Candidatus Treponema excrementipullorum]|nr:iron ABC transporter permease [Spirochaetia bacterium]MDY2756020.1 iron ABC transporter permease [Candidatus Treponema excrementipullorum]